MGRLNPEDWSEYWQKSCVTTFAWSFKNNYDHEIFDFWKSQLEGQCLEHIVDLACGNGALVWIADQICNRNEQKTRVTGVDIADINPFDTLQKSPADHPMVRFVGNTGIERLPFADGSVDMAISQYGLEYSMLDKTIPELGRILKPCAKMSFILHDQQSDILKDTVPQIPLIQYALDGLKLHEYFLNLDVLYNSAKNVREITTRPDLVAGRAQVNMALADIGNRVQDLVLIHGVTTGAPLIDNYVGELKAEFAEKAPFRNAGRRENILGHYETMRKILARITDLHAAALSEDDLDVLVGYIRNQGFVISRRDKLKYQQFENWGTILVAERVGAI